MVGGWLRRTPAQGSRRAVRARALSYLRQQGKAGPALRDALPGMLVFGAAFALPLLILFVVYRVAGLVGLVVVLVLVVALVVAVRRRRAVIARRRSGLYTAAELRALDGEHALARVTARILRRDGWRVRSQPWQGTPRLMARDGDGRVLEVTVRTIDSAGEATPAPAPLRRAGTEGYGGVLRLVVTRGRYGRQDVLWASRQGGVLLLDGQQLEAWAAGADLSTLVGPLPLPRRRDVDSAGG
ncbi:hypothetical protein ADK60_40330 [Streptomyces sp. XY431]|nr:hypothetical protein ADK60_40330 [Streptomyces sp. XY431]